jgi:hypothetical protein
VTEEIATGDQDEFEKFARDLAATKESMRKTPPSVDNLKGLIVGTVLPLMEELVALTSRSINGIYAEFDDRMAVLEGDGTIIGDEDAEKLTALATGTIWLIDLISGGDVAAMSAAKDRIVSLKILADECMEIVSDSRVESADSEPAPDSGVRPGS